MTDIKFTMESGTTYTLVDDHHFRIKKGDSGYEWSIKPWQWFAFDEEDPAIKSGIGGWNMSNVINMGYMFRDASAFNQDIGAWNTTSVQPMANIFEEAPSFNQGIGGILDNAKRLDPVPGLRLMVYGKDEWRISTRIKTIEETDE